MVPAHLSHVRLRALLAAVDRDAHAVNQQTVLAERIISAIQSRATSRTAVCGQ
jgi:hypothetical protein